MSDRRRRQRKPGGLPLSCPQCGESATYFDPSRVDELSLDQARELHGALARYGYCAPDDAPRDGGETR